MKTRKRRLVLLVAAGLTLGGLAFCGNGQAYAAATNAPQSIRVGNSGDKWVTVSQGKIRSNIRGDADNANSGFHRCNIIKQDGKTGRDAYVFCIDWSKRAPSNRELVAQYQANGAVQWLVTDFTKGHNKSFESIDGVDKDDYDLADYWLYQIVIHMVASPNATYNGDKADAYMDQFDPGIRNKIYRLKAEALKHKNDSSSEIVLNSASLNFDPSSLNLGSGDLHGDNYEKGFTTKSNNMHDIQVHAKDSKYEKYLSGTRKNGSKIDLQNVNDGDNLKVSVPYKDAGKDGFSFQVKATGHWNKEARVAWIYGAGSEVQQVAKSTVKASTVPMNAETLMTVNVKPSLGRLTFIKKGTGNDNKDVLEGTQFELTSSDGFSQKQTAGQDGRVTFDNLPLGKKYHLKEVKQPNKNYNGNYDRDITELTGNNPQRDVDLGTLYNTKRYANFELDKKNVSGSGIAGAQFVLIKKTWGANFDYVSIEDAKKQALREVNGELVDGHADKSPYIATTNDQGKAYFNQVLLDDDFHDYYAVEIKSPNGYALGTKPIKLEKVGRTSPNVVKGEMTDTVQPIPTTGSETLLLEAVTVTTIVTLVVGYGYHESKKER
ncbi:MSCRAMM family protein [Lactobacillus johnsonii]|uniref:Cell wall anchor protein n=1 Tax=Lactobacillus johnsonii TaxID=33959 RepID=A0A9X7T5E6_LACJH|nr:SpaA isopeptide-forming pilin-related protein [Lactobacillus johnsonii]QIA88524.1 cell wall anchor protein [Lactobacillus johnsonii]